jgi:hypothetical protein
MEKQAIFSRSAGYGGHTRRACRPSSPPTDLRPGVNTHAAGLDIGREEIGACVREDREAEPVRSFGTLPPDLYALADWLAPRPHGDRGDGIDGRLVDSGV